MGVVGTSRAYEAAMLVLLIWRERHEPATVRDVAARMGLSSSYTAHRHLQRAAAMGLIDMRGDGTKRRRASIWPVSDCTRPTCGASHVSESA